MTNAVVLPLAIRQQVQRLPDAARDIVAQQLRNPPTPPILYEEAVKKLAAVRDIDMTKRILVAAEGLALWGKLHEDNRAIIEAQKLKAHALRQMYLCAKMLGQPYEVLAERRIGSSKAKRGEELASFEDKSAIDQVADEIAKSTRVEFLVGRIADKSPLAKERYAANVKKIEEQDRCYKEDQAREKRRDNSPQGQFKKNVIDPLISAQMSIEKVQRFGLLNCSSANKKWARERIIEIMEALDEIQQECEPRRPGRPRKELS